MPPSSVAASKKQLRMHFQCFKIRTKKQVAPESNINLNVNVKLF